MRGESPILLWLSLRANLKIAGSSHHSLPLMLIWGSTATKLVAPSVTPFALMPSSSTDAVTDVNPINLHAAGVQVWASLVEIAFFQMLGSLGAESKIDRQEREWYELVMLQFESDDLAKWVPYMSDNHGARLGIIGRCAKHVR